MVDNSKYLNLLKQETNKTPYYLLALKKEYERRLSHLTDSREDFLIKDYFNKLFLEFNFEMNRMLPSQTMNLLVIPLLGRCNLNCMGCDAYAPLCKDSNEYYSVEEINEDLKILNDKGFTIGEISLEGGEPFLHPQLLEVAIKVREVFPNTHVTILTNGTLLKEKDTSFYETLAHLNYTLVIDKYFDIENFEGILSSIRSTGLNIELDGCVDGSGWFHRAPLDLHSTFSSEDEEARHFVKCDKANNIYTLDRGFLYPCGRSASIKYFNKYFNTSLPDDGVDIRKYEGLEIAQKLALPNKLCKYCKPLSLENMKWKESEYKLEEWADL
jgi:uncharacterized Fe-S cluster-containing radical SAM superfamily protein